MQERYVQRGVSSAKEDVHRAIKGLDKGLFPKAFCKIVEEHSIKTDDPNNPLCAVMHADGAGTKSSLAYAYWRETGDISVWDGIAQDAIVMNTDDLLCVGITDNIYLSSTIGRNKNLIPGEVISRIISGTQKFVSKMSSFGINLIQTGGETADVGDLVRSVIVDTTAFAHIRRREVIDNSKIKGGDVIVGLASFGQAKYEECYNSGIGSNGLTSARHDIFSKYIAEKYPETYDGSIPYGLVYSGTKSLTSIEPSTGLTYGKLVLSPTRSYAPIIKDILAKYRGKIDGMIHCTGGAQTKVLNFVTGVKVIKDNMFDTPLLFRIIQSESGTPWHEMYKVFNMGHRMELYVPEEIAPEIITISKSWGVEAKVIGRVEKSAVTELEIHGEGGIYRY